LHRNLLFIFILLLLIVITGALLADSILSGPKKELHGQTLYDFRLIGYASPDTNVSIDILHAPLNVSNSAHPFYYELRERPMSIEEAADCVRSFIRNVSADVTFTGNASTYFGIVYEMSSGNGSFGVNPMTGQVFRASFDNPLGRNVSLGMDEAKSIALEFVRSHYKGFDSLKGMTLTDSLLMDQGSSPTYTFLWHEYLDGVQTLNDADVEIDANSGKFWYYSGLELPVPALLKHTIGWEQAVDIALARLGNFSTDDVRAFLVNNRSFNITFLAEPSATGDLNATIYNISASQQFVLINFTQRQVWNVIVDEQRSFLAHDPDGGHPDFTFENYHGWWINVDAGTGEVVSIDRCM
jgi:hypothetical protein